MRKEAISFGGFGSSAGQETWVWDGSVTNWARRSPLVRPSARGVSAAAFDPSIVLFGGQNNAGNGLDDTWLWDGNNWTLPPPLITTQPQSQTVIGGSNATLTVFGTGTVAISYQWRRNGINLIGANQPMLTLTNMLPTQSGNYDVVVANVNGSVTSQVARVTAINITKQWVGGGDDKSWNNTTNWSGGVLPTSTDSIFIGSGSSTITNLPSGLTLNNLVCQRSLGLTFSLRVTGAVDVVSNLYFAPGISIIVSGTDSSFVGEGSTTADHVNMYAPLRINKNQHVGRSGGFIQAASLRVRSVASISFWRFW